MVTRAETKRPVELIPVLICNVSPAIEYRIDIAEERDLSRRIDIYNCMIFIKIISPDSIVDIASRPFRFADKVDNSA